MARGVSISANLISFRPPQWVFGRVGGVGVLFIVGAGGLSYADVFLFAMP